MGWLETKLGLHVQGHAKNFNWTTTRGLLQVFRGLSALLQNYSPVEKDFDGSA